MSTVCAFCGRPPEQPLLHAYDYGHQYHPMSACPHGRRPIECDECHEQDCVERLDWDDAVDGRPR